MMTSFRLRELRVSNYRCFGTLRLPFEEDATVVFAENGGGKTAVLAAVAMGLAVLQRGAPRALKIDPQRDAMLRTLDEKRGREPAGPCTIEWVASTGSADSVEWSTTVQPASGRITKKHHPVLEAIEQIRVPGDRWPLFAWYGVDRLGRAERSSRKAKRTRDRWEAYTSALDPTLDEGPLLQWLQDEMLGDVSRRRQAEPERFFDKAVMDATARATPGVVNAWYDPVEQSPMVRFDGGNVSSWSELSDGYHVFIALVADIARRAVMLNEIDGAEAPARVEGVVLIDELDLHLHPRWQRVALPSLRATFPRLQFIVTTHSPQVLSSVDDNRQARLVMEGKLWDGEILVAGRDTNSIMREYFRTDDRDPKGVELLRRLDDAIDSEEGGEARKLFARLLRDWGHLDTSLIRRKSKVEKLK